LGGDARLLLAGFFEVIDQGIGRIKPGGAGLGHGAGFFHRCAGQCIGHLQLQGEGQGHQVTITHLLVSADSKARTFADEYVRAGARARHRDLAQPVAPAWCSPQLLLDDSEENRKGTLNFNERAGLDMANGGTDLIAFDGKRFVDHDLRRFLQTVAIAGLDGDTQ
jgi:hypothetical protein